MEETHYKVVIHQDAESLNMIEFGEYSMVEAEYIADALEDIIGNDVNCIDVELKTSNAIIKEE